MKKQFYYVKPIPDIVYSGPERPAIKTTKSGIASVVKILLDEGWSEIKISTSQR